ncbi:MAG: SurA N-terminal domain-containing protein, partial [Pseudomonadota bacterium]
MAKGKASQTFVWIILGLLIVALMGFGATSFSGSGSAIARVGSAEVTVEEYGRALNQELGALQAQAGRAIPLSEARNFGIDQVVLGRLVGAAAIDDQASLSGVSVGDDRIATEVRANPAFIGLDGSFDREAYQFSLGQNGLSVREYESTVRTEISRQIVQAGIAGGIDAPPAYVDALMNFIREGRDVSWVAVTEEDLAEPVPEPTEAELIRFHGENESAFTLAEAKGLTIASLTPDMLIDAIEIDEARLQEIYNQRIAEYEIPERRLVERLVYGNEADAAAALARVESGEATFEDLVEERGLALADIDLGDVTENDLGDAGEAVFALDGPGLAGPAPSNLGPALFRMNAIFPAASTSFEEAQQGLREELAADQARRIILDEISPVDDLLAGGATLEELADETEMVLSTLEWRPGDGDGLAAYEAIRRAASLVTEDDFPEIVELEDGGIAALRLNETIEPRLQPLDEVREEVANAWRAQERGFRLAARAEDLDDALRDGTAEELSLTAETGLFRDGFVEGTPPNFLPVVFEMDPGEIRVIEGFGSAVVARLDAVNPPSDEDADNENIRALLASQTAQSIASDLLVGFMEAARDTAGVNIDQTMIN